MIGSEIVNPFPEKLLQVASSEARAIKLIKDYYECFCVSSNIHYLDLNGWGESLDGCHFFEKGNPNYLWMKCIPANIFPLRHLLHTDSSDTFDYITFFNKKRPVSDKVGWILNKAHEAHKHKVMIQIKELCAMVDKRNES